MTPPTATPDAPAAPAELFQSAAEQAAHYNALERAQPVTDITPVEPAAQPAPTESSSPQSGETQSEPPVEPATEPAKADDADDSPAPLFFRNDDGTFRKAKGSEIRSKLREETQRWQAKYRDLERQVQARTSAPAPVSQPSPAPATSAELGDRPSLEAFNTFEEWQKADTEWLKQYVAQDREQQQREYAATQARAAFDARVAKFTERHPDYMDVVDSVSDLGITPLIGSLLSADDRGPEFAYHLANYPDYYADLVLQTANTPVNEHTLTVLRRRLQSRLDAASVPTGTASPAVPRVAASPIAPVRTSSPVATDRPPGDNESAKAHAEYYNRIEREERQRRLIGR